VQNVTAVGGFAYGAVGADIHVFGNGLPLYLLANWHTPAGADREWLRELPSRMLNARRAVVPFTGREDELAQLRRWRDDGPRLAARWLHGPGGAGKTRLAAEFAAESAAAGWRVIAAFHGPDADPIEPGSQDLSLADRAGVLVIVDYADRWLLTNLTWLLKNALLHRGGVPTRVLLVARTADGWPAVRGILDTHQAGTSSRLLPALAAEGDERTGMFAIARDSFAALYQVPSAAEIEAPGPLDDPEFGLTLAVHMAALVAVDARVSGDRPPADMAGLTMYLLDREQLHWRRLYGDHADRPDAGHTYRTAPEVMKQAVFTAAITGTVPRGVGTALLTNLGLADPEQVLDDHAVCYPPCRTPREERPGTALSGPARRGLPRAHHARTPRRLPGTALGRRHDRPASGTPRRPAHPGGLDRSRGHVPGLRRVPLAPPRHRAPLPAAAWRPATRPRRGQRRAERDRRAARYHPGRT